MTKDTYAILVNLPDTVHEPWRPDYQKYKEDFTVLVDRGKVAEKRMLAEAAREAGLKVAIIFDYFEHEPFHEKPPHVDSSGKIMKSKVARSFGLGYLPFAWIDGWNYARAAIRVYTEAIQPDFVQQGIQGDVINWYRENVPEKPHWGYNDVMGMFMQGLRDALWTGTYVVSGYYTNSLRKAREYFGSAIKDEDLAQRLSWEILDPPPPDDDDDDDVEPPVDEPEYVARYEFDVAMSALTAVCGALNDRLLEVENKVKTLEDDFDDLVLDQRDTDKILERIMSVFGGWLL